MTLSKIFFNSYDNPNVKGVARKNFLIKRSAIAYLAMNGECTLAELAKELHISVPTITKLISELVADNIIVDSGKIETSGGRRPNIFGLVNTAIFFVGVEIARDAMHFIVTDIQNTVIKEYSDMDFELADTAECLEIVCKGINSFIEGCGVERSKILGIGVCIFGRVNPYKGRSYLYFSSEDSPLKDILEQRTGIKVLLENDTRARCYAEYFSDNMMKEKNMLYLHLGHCVAIGIVVGGKLYYGKSGFAGEFGHTPFFNNEKICFCGKKGCLETEISGMAIEEQMVNEIRNGVNTVLKERYEAGESIRIDDIIDAASNNDNLAIDLIEQAGEKTGKSIAYLINIFNPEVVIIGGILSRAGDYLMLPLLSSTNKYSLNPLYRDTSFRLSKMGKYSGHIGAAMLVRNYIIGL